MNMFYLSPLILFAIWTGFTVLGAGFELGGAMHWFGALVIGTFWCLTAFLKSLLGD